MNCRVQVDVGKDAALSVPALARAAGVSANLIYQQIRSGEIKAIRIGRRIIVPAPVARQLLGIEQNG